MTKVITLLLLSGALLLLSNANAQDTRPEKPNVIILLTDDLGWQDLKCYDIDNPSAYDTPYPDAFAKKGVLFWHIASTYKDPPSSIIRKGDWKLIQFLKQGNIELYNLKDDLKESNNLAKKNPQKAELLLKELINWRKKNKVPLPPSSSLKH